MKKLTSIILSCLLAFSVVGCTQKASVTQMPSVSPEQSTQQTSTNKETIKLTYWYSWTDKIQENNINLTKQFNETIGKEKGIEVTAEYQGSYDELHAKLQSAYVAGDVPAVTVMEIASTKTFAQNGVIEPLDKFIQRDSVDMTDYYPGLLINCKVDEQWFGIPYLRSTPIMYMNKTLLEKAGLDPTGPKTWDELAQYCRTVKEKTGVFGLSMQSYIWVFEAFMMENGLPVLNDDETKTNINSPEGVNVVTFFKNLQKEGVVRLLAKADSDSVKADVLNQNTAIWFSSTGDLTNNLSIAKENGFEIATAFIPKQEAYGVPTGGCNLVMTTKISEQEKEAAWEFIKWMTEAEQAAYSTINTGYVPTSKTCTETEQIQTLFKETPQFKVAIDQLEQYSVGRPTNPGYTECQVVIESALDAMWANNENIETTLADTATKVNKILQEN